MYSIKDFVQELQKYKNSVTVTNPYRDSHIADNLELYLEYMNRLEGKRILLVGEAPGYKGCKITGIPFSSGKVFERFDHPLLQALKEKVWLKRVESENTATIVWGYLSNKETTPLFWNSFPFHPHPKGNENANRAPTTEEIRVGIGFLQKLSAIYKPDSIAGIGNKGTDAARRAFPDLDIIQIRHPSFGGKAEFIIGMDKIM